MMHFTVEDYSPLDSSCQKCCCERLNLKPGTTTKISVGYAPWAAPIGRLHCTPQFQIEPKDTCPAPVGSNMPPQAAAPVIYISPVDTLLEGELKLKITDPESVPLKFALLTLYGPKYGKLNLVADGTFDYLPVSGWTGVERFYVSASDGVNSTIFEVMFGIGVTLPSVVPTPHISIGPATLDNRFYAIYFPVTLSPAAQDCEMWRLTVLQAAIDCECLCYTRSDCFDIGVGKC